VFLRFPHFFNDQGRPGGRIRFSFSGALHQRLWLTVRISPTSIVGPFSRFTPEFMVELFPRFTPAPMVGLFPRFSPASMVGLFPPFAYFFRTPIFAFPFAIH